MTDHGPVIVALSGGVDSAVAALLLRDQGYAVQCIHMSNWEDDGYCEGAREFQDARMLCKQLGLPLHRVNFSEQYRRRVFDEFLEEHRRGRTPNPDVICNREIKFGLLRRYARRLGGRWLATGHYARLHRTDTRVHLLKGCDENKDQSYFLHAVAEADLADVMFPLGEMHKREVRSVAQAAGLLVADKKDSTGICFIGERPFAEFLGQYLPDEPGEIKDLQGRTLGTHRGIAFYTLGQRHGLGVGGQATRAQAPWYVAHKDPRRNELIVVQGNDHPRLYQNWLRADRISWINAPPADWAKGVPLSCRAKTRYRQPDQKCTVTRQAKDALEINFDSAQRAITPGQSVVLYQGDRCLGGATICQAEMREDSLEAVL